MSKIISWTIKLGNKKVWVCGTRLGMRENYMMHIRMKRTTGIRKAGICSTRSGISIQSFIIP